MSVEFPQIDYIMHATLEKMSYAQRAYLDMLNKNNNFINNTFSELLDRISRVYNETSIIDILNLVRSYLDDEENSCPDIINYDDFVRNAVLSSDALNKIIQSPSSKLIKVERKLPINKVTHFDSKTMMWLSKRPGSTIKEKVSPKNVIPTKVTEFTFDTVENRHAMYLFDILYDYLYDKVTKLPCHNCDHKCSFYEKYEKLDSLLFLKYKIKNSKLKSVKKEKQVKQNNKLLADKEYKIIWDSVRELDFYEYNCNMIWNNLKERYQFLVYLFICEKIYSIPSFRIFNTNSRIVDYDGILKIINDNNEINTMILYQECTMQELDVVLKDEKIIVDIYKYYSLNDVSYSKKLESERILELANIFDDLDNLSKIEEVYNNIKKDIKIKNEEIISLEDELKEFQLRKPYYERIMFYLNGIVRGGK